MDPLEEWIESAGSISLERWKRFQADYLDERGLSRSEVSMYVPQHPAMDGYYRNWVRLLPDDAVTRLQRTDDFVTEFGAIIAETYERMESSVEDDLEALVDVTEVQQEVPAIDSKSGQLAYLCSLIIPQLRGDVNVAQLRQGRTEVPSEPAIEPPEYGSTITVERRNERNMLDVAIFSIDDPVDFFGPTYGDSTLMLGALIEADIEPDKIIFDQAFDAEGSSWVKSEPPEHAIAYRATDHKNRAQFFKIHDPRGYYGDSWGDIQEMVVENGNSDEGLDKREFLYDTGSISWQIAIGI